MKSIEVHYISPTDTEGAKVKAFDRDGNSVTVSYDSRYDFGENAKKAALLFCSKYDWQGRLHRGSIGGAAIFVFETKEAFMTHPYTEEEKQNIGREIGRIFQFRMTRDGRYVTTWGDKSEIGLFEMILTLAEKIHTEVPIVG